MGFTLEKARALRKYNKALNLGLVDKPIIEMIDFINKQDDYYTTSSCAGRVIFLHEYGKRKVDNDFIVKEHEKVNLDDFLKADLSKLQGKVWLKQEPVIIHIAAKTLDKAVKVLEIGLKSGLKHSGVFVFKEERYVLEINGTHSMAVPISEGGKLLFPEEYLIYLLRLADEKLQKNKVFRDRFERALREALE
jgi:tRNA wybutosine-synthesizing protein 3